MGDLVLEPASVLEVVAAADAAARCCAQARSALSDVTAVLTFPSDAAAAAAQTGGLGSAVASAAQQLDSATDALQRWSRDTRAAVDRVNTADTARRGAVLPEVQRLLIAGGRLLEPAAALGAAVVRSGAGADGLAPPLADVLVGLPGVVAREAGEWFQDGPGWFVTDGRPPGAAALGAAGGLELPGGAAAVRDLLAGVDALAPGTVAVVPVRGTDGITRYVVELRGVHALDAGDPQDFRDTVPALFAGTSAYAGAVRRALASLCLPRGSEVLVVGHSLGGITALDLARDPAFNGAAFRVTQVLTAGSPVSGLHPRPGTHVLEIDNADDLVPHLDLRDSRAIDGDGDGRVVAVFDHQTGTVGGNHNLAASYEPFVMSTTFGQTPGMGGWLAGARPFLTGRAQPGALFSLQDRP